MSSILSTSSCGEGTQTTSLPDWPTSGLNSAFGVCAKAQTAIAERTSVASDRLAQCHAVIFLLQVVFGKKGNCRCFRRPRRGAISSGLQQRDFRRSESIQTRMMAPPRSARQPLHELGRYCGGTFVPSAAEPHRQLLTVLPVPAGGIPVLSRGIKVRSLVSSRPSPNPRSDTVIIPTGSVETEST